MANRQKMNPTRLEVVQIKAPTGFQTAKSIYGKEKAIQINYSAHDRNQGGHLPNPQISTGSEPERNSALDVFQKTDLVSGSSAGISFYHNF